MRIFTTNWLSYLERVLFDLGCLFAYSETEFIYKEKFQNMKVMFELNKNIIENIWDSYERVFGYLDLCEEE